MATIQIDIPDAPGDHGLSFKKGIADGLLDYREQEQLPRTTYSASYQRGFVVGTELKCEISRLAKRYRCISGDIRQAA